MVRLKPALRKSTKFADKNAPLSPGGGSSSSSSDWYASWSISESAPGSKARSRSASGGSRSPSTSISSTSTMSTSTLSTSTSSLSSSMSSSSSSSSSASRSSSSPQQLQQPQSQLSQPLAPILRQKKYIESLTAGIEGGDAWRKDGKEVRKQLLEEDERNGGSDFHINQNCPLRNYCAIADRVQDQFQAAYSTGTKLNETYIMGNRLIKFLSAVLPTHRHYHSKRPECTRLRTNVQNDLVRVKSQVNDVALLLDREIYKKIMEMQGLEFEEDRLGIGMDVTTKDNLQQTNENTTTSVRRRRNDKKLGVNTNTSEYSTFDDNPFDHDIDTDRNINANAGSTPRAIEDSKARDRAMDNDDPTLGASDSFEFPFFHQDDPPEHRHNSIGRSSSHSRLRSRSRPQERTTRARTKKVTFNPEVTEYEHKLSPFELNHYHNPAAKGDESDHDNSELDEFGNAIVPIHGSSLSSSDVNEENLAHWTERDPVIDMADLSFSSEGSRSQQSSSYSTTHSFDTSFSDLTNSLEPSVDHARDTGKDRDDQKQSIHTQDNGDAENEINVLDVFSGIDDGWEHFGGSSNQMEWPELKECNKQNVSWGGSDNHSDEYGQDEENLQDESPFITEEEVYEGHEGDEGGNLDDSNEAKILIDGDSVGYHDDHVNSDSDSDLSFSSESLRSSEVEQVSFMERIARENYIRPIDDLQEEDDDSAADSWAQGEDSSLETEQRRGKEEEAEVPDRAIQANEIVSSNMDDSGDEKDSFHDNKSNETAGVSTIEAASDTLAIEDTMDPNEEEKSLPLPIHYSAEALSSTSLDYSSSLDYSYSSGKSGVVSNAEWDTKELEECSYHSDLRMIASENEFEESDGDFDNSTIIAESPDDNFNFEDVSDDEMEHKEYVNKMTQLEFIPFDPCDASGGDKTITTTSTADTDVLTGEEDNGSHSSGSGSDEDDNGIRNHSHASLNKKLGDELDILEYKIEELLEKKGNEHLIADVNSTPTSSDDVGDKSPCRGNGNTELNKPSSTMISESKESTNISIAQRLRQVEYRSRYRRQRILNSVGTKLKHLDVNEHGKATDSREQSETRQEVKSQETISQNRRHPTAARLKTLRQSAAWKRRYGKQ